MHSSYSATRIQVMRTRLLKPADYERLLKMTEQEIVGFLQATEYRQDIDALSLKELEDLEIVDKMIAHNNSRLLIKLQKISSEEFRTALDLFLIENDRWNLRVIAEAITSKKDAKEMLNRYAKHGTFDPMQYANAKSIEELVKLARKHIKFRSTPKALNTFVEAINKKKQLTNPHLIDEQNILTVLMQKREKIAPERIIKHLLRGGTVPLSIIRDAANAQTFQDALKVLHTTKYGKALSSETLIAIEYELHYDVLKRIRRLSGINPLHVETLIRYLIEKDIETANIRLLLKGKHLGLEDAFLREQLVI